MSYQIINSLDQAVICDTCEGWRVPAEFQAIGVAFGDAQVSGSLWPLLLVHSDRLAVLANDVVGAAEVGAVVEVGEGVDGQSGDERVDVVRRVQV